MRVIKNLDPGHGIRRINELNKLKQSIDQGLSQIDQLQPRFINTSLEGPTISDRMKQAISNLNSTASDPNINLNNLNTQNQVISSIDLLNSMKEKVNNAYNDDQIEYINEERETINVELDKAINDIGDIDSVIIFDGKKMKTESNSNDYIKTPESDIIITNISNNNSVIEVGESTIPSNLENVINPSAYSNTHEFQINKNQINVESQLNYNGPTIVTESANEALEKMIIKYNFNDDEINLLKLKVKEILGFNDLNGTDLPKKVETSNTNCYEFRSYNELNQNKEIYSSKVLTLKNCSKENVTLQVSKVTNSLIKTNNLKVKGLDLEEFNPKRKLMFLTRREINILANSLKYNKQDFENIALKLRIKHHRITDFAPVYKNGIYVRFAKWNEKLANDEYFATKPLKVIIF